MKKAVLFLSLGAFILGYSPAEAQDNIEYEEDNIEYEEPEECADGDNYKCAHKVDTFDRGVEYIEITIGNYPRDDRDRYGISLLIKNNKEMEIFGSFRRCAYNEMYGTKPSESGSYYKLTTKQKMDLADKQLSKYQLAECKSGRCSLNFDKLYKNPYLGEFTKSAIERIAENYKDYKGLDLFYEFFYEKLQITSQFLQSTDDEVMIEERDEELTRLIVLYEDICGSYVMKKEIFDANKKIIRRELLEKLGISEDIIQQIDSLGIVE